MIRVVNKFLNTVFWRSGPDRFCQGGKRAHFGVKPGWLREMGKYKRAFFIEKEGVLRFCAPRHLLVTSGWVSGFRGRPVARCFFINGKIDAKTIPFLLIERGFVLTLRVYVIIFNKCKIVRYWCIRVYPKETWTYGKVRNIRYKINECCVKTNGFWNKGMVPRFRSSRPDASPKSSGGIHG